MKHIFFLLFLSFLFACQQEKPEENYLILRTKNEERIKVQKDSLLVLNPSLMRFPQGRTKGTLSIDTVYGAIRFFPKTKTWFKISFTEDVSEKLKAHRLYYAQIVVAEQEFETSPDRDYFSYYTVEKQRLGFIDLQTQEMGYQIGHGDGKTYLLYVGYDEQLNKMNTFYPCHPNKMIWYIASKPYTWILPL